MTICLSWLGVMMGWGDKGGRKGKEKERGILFPVLSFHFPPSVSLFFVFYPFPLNCSPSPLSLQHSIVISTCCLYAPLSQSIVAIHTRTPTRAHALFPFTTKCTLFAVCFISPSLRLFTRHALGVNETVTVNSTCLQSADVVAAVPSVMKFFTVATVKGGGGLLCTSWYSGKCLQITHFSTVEVKAKEETLLLGTDLILSAMSKHVSVCHMSNKCSRSTFQTL